MLYNGYWILMSLPWLTCYVFSFNLLCFFFFFTVPHWFVNVITGIICILLLLALFSRATLEKINHTQECFTDCHCWMIHSSYQHGYVALLVLGIFYSRLLAGLLKYKWSFCQCQSAALWDSSYSVVSCFSAIHLADSSVMNVTSDLLRIWSWGHRQTYAQSLSEWIIHFEIFILAFHPLHKGIFTER